MEQKHMFTNKMIADLLIPVVLEQLLNSIMGTADTMMVSNVGSAAISAVSLVDSINVLVIQAFSALAAGGAIVCAQYIGQKNVKRANESARQGAVYYYGNFGCDQPDLSCFPKADAASDLWISGGGGHACVGNLFLLHGTVLSVYRSL